METFNKASPISCINHELAILQDKLLSALEEISQENFSVSDDTILDKMYVHLESTTNVKEIFGSCLSKLNDWVESILKEWNEDKLFYDVKKFSLRFIGLLGSFQRGFESLNIRGLLQDFLKVINCKEMHRDASMFVPSVMSLKMFLNHEQGLQWVAETGVWRFAVTGYYNGRSMYAKRVCIEFLSTLLTRRSCCEVMALVCEPLLEETLINIVRTDLTSVSVMALPEDKSETTSSKKDNRRLLVGAEFLSELLSRMLSDESCKHLTFRIQMAVVNSVSEDQSNEREAILGTTKLITETTTNSLSTQALATFAELVLLIDLSNCSVDKTTLPCPMLHLHSHAEQVLFNVLLEKKAWSLFINHCVTCLSWCHKLSLCKCEQCFFFQSSLVNHMFGYLWPLTKYTQFIETSTENLKRTENLLQKTLGDCSREFEEHGKKSVQIYFASQGVSGLSRSVKFLSQEKIVKHIYDVLAKTLKSMCLLPEWSHAHDSLCIDILTLITKTVDHNHSFFQQSCKESGDLLLRSIIKVIRLRSAQGKTRIVVTSLQTLKAVVRINGLYLADHSTKMSPMLAGFTESVSLLETQLESNSWEIRDTLLELFQTTLELSGIAPWLFDNVFVKSLLDKIFALAAKDDSSYVRASAVNFFARAGKLRMFDDIISFSTLVELALSSVIEDTMPVVRRAACELISALYISDIPAVDQNKLCKTMFTVTAKDLDWEVKKKSLQFWRCVIDKLMLERKIPMDVKCLYFLKCSKEEVTFFLVKLLEDLGGNGCLKATWIGLNDECDLKVSEEAYSLVTYLQGLDEQWAFIEPLQMSDLEPEPFDCNIQNIKLHPKEFFRLLKMENWEEKLASRKKWIENSCDDLQTILDHILNADNKIDDWDHNVVDCD